LPSRRHGDAGVDELRDGLRLPSGQRRAGEIDLVLRHRFVNGADADETGDHLVGDVQQFERETQPRVVHRRTRIASDKDVFRLEKIRWVSKSRRYVLAAISERVAARGANNDKVGDVDLQGRVLADRRDWSEREVPERQPIGFRSDIQTEHVHTIDAAGPGRVLHDDIGTARNVFAQKLLE
jgi:hypothetical protein